MTGKGRSGVSTKCDVKPPGLRYGNETSPPAGVSSNVQPVKKCSGKHALIELEKESSGCSMRKSFNYRLYPSKRQQRLLSEQLEEERWLWNPLLVERQQA